MNISEDAMRMRIFARIEREILPAAAKRADAIDPFTVEDVAFGSRPAQKAFGADGDLRFEIGRWDGCGFVPFNDRLMFPHPPAESSVAYPEETAYLWRNVTKHYTPVTRRLDYFEVWDYFSARRARDEVVREKAFGLLATKIASEHPAGRVAVSCRYIRYAEQYVSVTCVESRELSAAGRDERIAVARLTA